MWCGWVQGNSNGPLVPMVRLVPLENDVIPMVLLVNMHLILSCGVAGCKSELVLRGWLIERGIFIIIIAYIYLV